MNGIVIIGHGNFGSGLNSTLELIAGKYDFVKYGDFTSEKSPEEFKEEVKLELEKLKDKEKIFFFTDVVGGTPFILRIIYVLVFLAAIDLLYLLVKGNVIKVKS